MIVKSVPFDDVPDWAMCITNTGLALKQILGEHPSEVLSSLTWLRQSSQTAFGLEDRIETILAHFLSRRSVFPFFLVAVYGRRYQTPCRKGDQRRLQVPTLHVYFLVIQFSLPLSRSLARSIPVYLLILRSLFLFLSFSGISLSLFSCAATNHL